MPRILSPITRAATEASGGTEPLLVVKIEWSSGSVWYSDKDLMIEEQGCIGQLVESSEVSAVVTSSNIGEYSSLNITLFDFDGALKRRVNRERLEGVNCIVYHHYADTGLEDLVVLLNGKMEAPVWDEGTRRFSCTIETAYKDKDIGFTPETDAFAGFNNDVAGQMWPLCFGTVLHSPTVKAKAFGISSKVLTPGSNVTISGMEYIPNSFAVLRKLVNNVDQVPLDTDVTVTIDGLLKFSGQFKLLIYNSQGSIFNVPPDQYYFQVGSVLPTHADLAFGPRVARDRDALSKRVAWLDETETANIAGQYVYVSLGGTWIINYCYNQEGRKCFFSHPFPVALQNGHTIYETAGIALEQWIMADYVLNSEELASMTVETSTYGTFGPFSGMRLTFKHSIYNKSPNIGEFVTNGKLRKGAWLIRKDATVLYGVAGGTDVYIANSIPSVEILDVFAYRQYGDARIFAPIPKSYYRKYYATNIGGQIVTAIEMVNPLLFYVSEKWEDDIYVSLRSSVGPNTANIIQYLFETYSDIEIDPATFAVTREALKNYWMCFTLTQSQDYLGLVNDLAYQARCAIVISGGIASLKFLAINDSPVMSITESHILNKTLQLASTSKDNLLTNYTGLWSKTYVQEEPDKYIYKNNADLYGDIKEEREFFAYNTITPVRAACKFWGYRHSNLWRHLNFDSALNALPLQPHDTIYTAIGTVSQHTLSGAIISSNHDNSLDKISLSLELASKVGVSDSSGEPLSDDEYWPGNDPNDVFTDPGTGHEEIEYDVPTTDAPPEQEEPPKSDLYFVFDQVPESAKRGEAFQILLTVRSASGALDQANRDVALSLHSGDDNDAMTPIRVTTSGGVWGGNITIAGGSIETAANITAMSHDIRAATSPDIRLVAECLNTLEMSIDSSLTRDTMFTFSVTGGPEDGSLELYLSSTDTNDLLVDSNSSPVTEILFDVNGEATESFKITGGIADAICVFTLIDPEEEYCSTMSDDIDLTGASARVVRDSIKFSDTVTSSSNTLRITAPDKLDYGQPFSLTVELLDPNGEVVELDSAIKLSVKGTGFTVIDGSPSGAYSIINLVGGTWSDSAVEINWGPLEIDPYVVSTIRFEAEIAIEDYILYGTAESQVGDLLGFVLLGPSNITRGVPFTLNIGAIHEDGSSNFTYAPLQPLLLTVELGNGEVITPDEVPITGWVNGTYSIECTISGGTGDKKVIVVGVEDLDTGGIGTTDIGIGYATNICSPLTGAYSLLRGFHVIDISVPFGQEDAWAQGSEPITNWNIIRSTVDLEYNIADVVDYTSSDPVSALWSGGIGIRSSSYDEYMSGYRDAFIGRYPISNLIKSDGQQLDLIMTGYIAEFRYILSAQYGPYWYNQPKWWTEVLTNGSIVIRFYHNKSDISSISIKGGANSITIPLNVFAAATHAQVQKELQINPYYQLWHRFPNTNLKITASEMLLSYIKSTPGTSIYASVHAEIDIPDYWFSKFGYVPLNGFQFGNWCGFEGNIALNSLTVLT